jgi:hypothetical protein
LVILGEELLDGFHTRAQRSGSEAQSPMEGLPVLTERWPGPLDASGGNRNELRLGPLINEPAVVY